MRIVLNTFGSFGDIHPYIPIAMELQSRGQQENGPARAADLIENVFGPEREREEDLVHVAGD